MIKSRLFTSDKTGMSKDNEHIQDELGGVPAWYREIFPAGSFDGFYQKMGPHSAVFVDRGTHQLVVSFDNLAEAGNPRYDREAWAAKFCADNGWSHLGVLAQPPSWFRDKTLIQFMEHLRDSAFFRRFDRVTFCGTSMGGFGALAFCNLSPGATVIAFSPQSTLAADLVPWEKRFAKGRKRDWSLPYSDAATQTKRADRVYVVYDPFFEEDVKQVARLSGDNIILLRGFGLGHKSALVLRRMERLKPVMKLAITGQLTELEFYKLIRNRKDIYLYRKNMEDYLLARGRTGLVDVLRSAFKLRRRRNRKLVPTSSQGSK